MSKVYLETIDTATECPFRMKFKQYYTDGVNYSETYICSKMSTKETLKTCLPEDNPFPSYCPLDDAIEGNSENCTPCSYAHSGHYTGRID